MLPSREDIIMTRQIISMLNVCNVKLLDHVIMANTESYSMQLQGTLRPLMIQADMMNETSMVSESEITINKYLSACNAEMTDDMVLLKNRKKEYERELEEHRRKEENSDD